MVLPWLGGARDTLFCPLSPRSPESSQPIHLPSFPRRPRFPTPYFPAEGLEPDNEIKGLFSRAGNSGIWWSLWVRARGAQLWGGQLAFPSDGVLGPQTCRDL